MFRERPTGAPPNAGGRPNLVGGPAAFRLDDENMLIRMPTRWTPLVLAACLFTSGCSSLDAPRGEKYEGEEATWGAALRPESENQGSLFFNDKSHQIEESLGL